jgi:hypothetical protein
MKKLILISTPLLCIWLLIGYYETRWVEDNSIRFFIKAAPTFKVGFINVYATDHEDHWQGQLEKKEREYAIDFCTYYLGVKTEMRTMKDFEDCREVYYKKRAKAD